MPTGQQFTIDTDLARIDLRKVHHWLSTDAYWALGRSYEVVRQAAEASINFGAYDSDGQLRGYARVVTDGVTFAWLCDVYVDRECRGNGLGQLISQAVVDELAPLNLKRILLMTSYSHSLYERVGFERFAEPGKVMVYNGNR
ncbi:MAG: GNAT family N-acetyltransferase [Trueperaceae bacterium]|jgi:GNAT superfamily N-acetyltransferase